MVRREAALHLILMLADAWRRCCWYSGCRLNGEAMNAAFILRKSNRDYQEYYNQHDALFVFGELKNSE